MQITESNTIEEIINPSLEKSFSYNAYRELVSKLAENNDTTGAEKTEALINYTALNDRRMKRWDKTIKLSPEAIARIKSFNKKITWLVLTESWCGDAAHLIPVMNKVAELNPNIDFKLVLRDENEALMNQFLTNGGKAIPKLIAIDKDIKSVTHTYGPRPTVATKMVNDYKQKNGSLTPEFKEDLQHWYNKDKGQNTVKDLLDLLEV